MKEKLNCAIYTRVSTDNQAEVEFNSCEAQKEKIIHFIKSQDGFSVYDVFNDEGYSGKDLNRPELQRMLDEIKKDRINCVITYKIDRLTRSPKDFYHLVEYFDKHKTDFISVTERFDTSTPSGRLLRNIMLTFAQFERELASERTRDKMLQRAEKGMWNGGIVSYSYKSENKKLIINKIEADVVKMMYEIYIKTRSLSAVYNMLIDKDIRDRNGKTFSKTSIFYILRNIIYIGKIKYAGKIYQANHEPLLSEDIFNMAQECHKEIKRKIRTYKNYLFPGLVRCKECGSVMTPTHTNKKTKGKTRKYHYYRCTSTYKHRWNTCSTRQVSAERLESLIFSDLERFSMDTNGIDNLIYRLNSQNSDGSKDKAGKFNMPDHSGLELQNICPRLDPIHFQQQLKMFLITAANRRGTDKYLWIKKYVKDILYSKETIEIDMYYYTPDNNQGSAEQASEKSPTRPDEEMSRDGVGDDPRRSAEPQPFASKGLDKGRSAEGMRPKRSEGAIFPSEPQRGERGIESKKEMDYMSNNTVRIFEMAPEFLISN